MGEGRDGFRRVFQLYLRMRRWEDGRKAAKHSASCWMDSMG